MTKEEIIEAQNDVLCKAWREGKLDTAWFDAWIMEAYSIKEDVNVDFNNYNDVCLN